MKQTIWFRRNCLIILESLNWIAFWKFYGCGYIERKLALYVTDITIIILHVLIHGETKRIAPVIWNYKWRNRICLLKVLSRVTLKIFDSRVEFIPQINWNWKKILYIYFLKLINWKISYVLTNKAKRVPFF